MKEKSNRLKRLEEYKDNICVRIKENQYFDMAVIIMLSQQEILEVLSENLEMWKRQYSVNRIALFGSYIREEQEETSDIDLLVEFDEQAMTFDNYMDFKFKLEDLFHKTVDLVIIDDIKPALKSEIIRSAKYAEGA